MKNKRENIIASGLLMSMAGTAMANSENFEGFGISAGASSLDVKIKSSGESDSSWDSFGKVDFTYFKSLDDKWLLGFGVGADIGTQKSDSTDSNGSAFYDINGNYIGSTCSGWNCYEYSGGKSKTKVSDNFSLSLMPAFAFTKNHLGFIRLSVDSIKAKRSGTGGGEWLDYPDNCSVGDPQPGCSLNPDSSGRSGSTRLTGFGVGLGYRYQSDNNWFLQAEYRYIDFNRNNRLDIDATISGATLSAGYKF